MAFPYGGSLTHAQLAEKFGWPSVIISILLLPVLWLWSRLLAFPVILCRNWIGNLANVFAYRESSKVDVIWKPFLINTIKYETENDVFREKVYFTRGALPGTRCPMGWDVYIDQEGGKFFEAFWGIINCLDYTPDDGNGRVPDSIVHSGRQISDIAGDVNGTSDSRVIGSVPVPRPVSIGHNDREISDISEAPTDIVSAAPEASANGGNNHDGSKGFIVHPNLTSWLITMVYCEFPKEEVIKHRVRFFFPLGGLNFVNPFAWMTMIYVGTALTWYGSYSFVGFKEEYGIITDSKYFFAEDFEDEDDDMTLMTILNSVQVARRRQRSANSSGVLNSSSSLRQTPLTRGTSNGSHGALATVEEGSGEGRPSSSRSSMNRNSLSEQGSSAL